MSSSVPCAPSRSTLCLSWIAAQTMRYVSASCGTMRAPSGIDDHALRQDAARFWSQNAARDESDDELVVTDHEGVAGIGPARVANDDIGVFGVEVDDLSLALVTPLRPHDHDRRHHTSP